MKQTMNVFDFHRAFQAMGRQDNFSYEGLQAMFEFLEDMERDTGDEYELDVIALCCEFTEYEDLEDFNRQQGTEFETWLEVQEKTFVIPVGDIGGIHESAIVQVY